jgi:putative transposase
MDHAHQFLSPFGPIYEHFKPKRHLMKAADYRNLMDNRFQVWQEMSASIGC